MGNCTYITLAIHTYDKAVALKKVLEAHSIDVKFEKISLDSASVNYGLRVKIPDSDLPLALKLVESGSEIDLLKTVGSIEGIKGNILIPIDFSGYSKLACKVGFAMAERLGLKPVLLHTYATPSFGGPLPYSDTTDIDITENVEDAEIALSVHAEAKKMMKRFVKSIYALQHKGELADIKFSYLIEEGLPEEVIINYSRTNPPMLIVMATRGKDKKEEDLIGSVTAEVLDVCRVPVFAVPEHYDFKGVKEIKELAFFCTLTQNDILSIDTLMRMFDFPEVNITLIPVNEINSDKCESKVSALQDYLEKNYPTAKFSHKVFKQKNFREDLEAYNATKGFELLIVPNKKMNAFRRFFNPGIAHRILFERDMPLLALPV